MMRLRSKATSLSCRLPGIMLVALAAAGCPGTVDPSLWPSSNAGEGGSGGPPPCDATPVFAAHSCTISGCHDDLGTSANFDDEVDGMGDEVWWASSRKVEEALPSKCATSSKPFLIPGVIPATGLFIDKVKPGAVIECGDPMPLVGTKLTDDDFACLQSWADALVMAGGSRARRDKRGGGAAGGTGGGAAGTGGGSGGTSGTGGRGGMSRRAGRAGAAD